MKATKHGVADSKTCPSQFRRGVDRRRGQSMVEFALMAPLLFLLLLGMVDFGRALFYANELTNAARDGARVAILQSNPCNTTLGASASCPLPATFPPRMVDRCVTRLRGAPSWLRPGTATRLEQWCRGRPRTRRMSRSIREPHAPRSTRPAAVTVHPRPVVPSPAADRADQSPSRSTSFTISGH